MKKNLTILGLLLGAAALWYFVSPLFNTIEVDDEVPMTIEPALMPSGTETLSPTDQAELATAMKASAEMETTAMTEPMPTTKPVVSQLSQVMGTIGHPAEGTVRVIETADGPVIRYENFKTINGPQLHLYLAKDLAATEYIDLGPIRGTEGNINYTVPEGVDLTEYRYVMYWCVPFGVLFNYADLSG